MIKRYILHIEFHWGYRPRISIKRQPRPGDKAFDGGDWGTLVRCPECGGEGLLHLIEPKKYMMAQPLPPGPHTWDGNTCIECEADISWCPYPPSTMLDEQVPRTKMELTLSKYSLDYKLHEIVVMDGAEWVVVEVDPFKRVVLERICTTCRMAVSMPPCSKNPKTGEGGHTYSGGVSPSSK